MYLGFFVYKKAETMTTIKCKATNCLNKKHGKCIANFIVFDRRCQAFFTSETASRYSGCTMKKEHNRYKSSKRSVLK